ncbi:hypothetical protein HHL22_14635 [Hymenobacter sp. RP-2-7]|uniref:Uncharacterized protein n=1 Tax=Hymenobacter polaris TaxID=2682546 RepID=A0A7Y0AFL0_9BACT|nr:hypothetical protein [Hymenobacter polaris]NML66446.1 hypothetical protein [Hymenobacter polaris]
MTMHLHAFIESFIDKRYKKQWLYDLEHIRLGHNSVKGMDALWRELDDRYCIQLPKGDKRHNIDFVRQAIAPYKLTVCYVSSADEKLNEQTMPIDEALDKIIGSITTTIVSFIPGKVAYFEGHSPGDRYICIRK